MDSNYGIKIWSDDNFIIEDGLAKINYDCKPSLISIVKDVRKQDFKGPLLLRFPHITEKQINTLYNTFNASIREYDYKGSFNAVFPLKVNQLPNFIHPLINCGKILRGLLPVTSCLFPQIVLNATSVWDGREIFLSSLVQRLTWLMSLNSLEDMYNLCVTYNDLTDVFPI